jgi:hypothetical protein
MYQINYYLFIFIWKIPVFDYPFQQVIGIGFFILRAAKKTRPPVSQYAANFNERKRFQMVSSGSSQFPHLPQTSREFVARFAPFIFSLFHSPLEHRKKTPPLKMARVRCPSLLRYSALLWMASCLRHLLIFAACSTQRFRSVEV